MPRLRPPAACLFAVLLLTGCSDESAGTNSAPAPAPVGPPLVVTPEVNQFLLEVATEHHLPARLEGDWVVFDGSPVRINGGVAPEEGGEPKEIVILQVDYRLRLPDGRVVVQPVVGWGEDRGKALTSSQASFLLGTFHAWLGAFVDPGEEHVESEKRTIGGRERVVTYGDALTKVLGGQEPPKGARWKEQFLAELEKSSLPPGLHWVDVYNGYFEEKQELEIQLDNERWTAMEQKMRGADWPKAGQFTSVRQFLLIQDVDDPTRPKQRPQTKPTTAATRAAESAPAGTGG